MTAGEAGADQLTAETATATLTASQEGTDVIKFGGGEAKCTTVKYVASALTSPATTVAITPTYSNCTFAGLAGTVAMNGCTYLMHISPSAGVTTASMDIVCPNGKEITITAPNAGTVKCIEHIPAQTGLSAATLTNVGSGATREITVAIALTELKYSQTPGTAESGNCATSDGKSDGTYTGKTLFTAENGSGAHVGIFLS